MYKIRRGVILDKAVIISRGTDEFIIDDLSEDDRLWLEELVRLANVGWTQHSVQADLTCTCASVVFAAEGEICDDCGLPIVGKSSR